ncbi:hypothetical protein N7495_007324 [Penicillium taxi]|uniref:uncharacterized protein n=1 Tax=Penicillium taxi TaxID=168475 RepID=UPI002544F8F0|nr:uncharacterized protein N7495_007324 [Penicillium taxi]KAJ5895633.1 hypothetical protein N7495_007324 [Penicillium taxi]
MSEYPEPSQYLLGPEESGSRATFNMGPHGDASESPEDFQAEAKRPRACEPCRQLKVRCDPDPLHPDGSCKRCAKSHRPCVVTAPTRKRQKKTDSRVSELERKIDALTATLQASQGNQFPMAPPVQPPETSTARRWLREDSNVIGRKRSREGLLRPQDSPDLNQSPYPEDQKQPAAKSWRRAGETGPPRPVTQNTGPDVIDRGIVSAEMASAAFDRYVNDMSLELPIVVFPPGTTMDDVRREKPALFLAIAAIASGPFSREVQDALLDEMYRYIADSIVVKGRKSLDLVQALLVSCIWYMPPDNLEELKFYQLIGMAVTLAMDMGLNRRSNGDLRPLHQVREVVTRDATRGPMDLDGPEVRRTWMGCYFLAIQVATALRRMQTVKWQPYMDESIRILETHPDALPSDHKLVWWAKLGFIMEEAGSQLTSEDPKSVILFTDSKTRFTIKAFANQLAQFRRDIPEEYWTVPLAHTHYTINLFVHESVMGIDCRDSMIPNLPLNEDPDLPPSAVAPFIDALTTCIRSIHQTFDVIINTSIDQMICLPTVAVARTAYAIVSLIKIYSLLTAQESRIGQVIDMQSLHIDYYLDKIISHYGAAAVLDGGRAVAKFGNIITMLRNWFLKKRDKGSELRELFGAELRSDTPTEKPSFKTGATHVEILSDLAMDDPSRIHHSPLTHLVRPVQSTNCSTPSPNQETNTSATNTPANSNYSLEQPRRTGSSASKNSDTNIRQPTPTWSSTSPFSHPIPMSQHPNMGNNNLYQSYQPATTDSSHQQYSLMQAPTSMGPYSNMPGVSMPPQPPMGMYPNVGMPPGMPPFDQDQLLGSMLDDSLLSFPFPFEGNFQF